MSELKNLMISVSGVRGIVGEGLTPDIAMYFAQAFGSEFGPGTVVLGRDSRATGEMIKHAVISGLMSVGCDVVDLGITTTPTTAIITEQLDSVGGIILTASHNPRQWNALKLLADDGMFLRPEQGEKVKNRVENRDFNFAAWDKMGKLVEYNTAHQEHIDSILDLPLVNLDEIKNKKFKVVVDCCNGAGGVVLPQLLETFGCEAIFLNVEANGHFPREPEPIPQNLGELCEAVKNNRADFGIAVDPDVDRLAMVDENGIPLGEEYTLALVNKFVLSQTPGDIVVNASTSRANDDVAAQAGGRVHRTPVGEIHVAMKAKKIGAVMAGEGNGGIIYPELHFGRDALVGIALVLQLLTQEDQPISVIKNAIPQYIMIKDKLSLGFGTDAKAVVQRLAEKHANDDMNTMDGVKLLFERSWVHIRASNTEPIIRVIAEAPTQEQAQLMVDDFKKECAALAN